MATQPVNERLLVHNWRVARLTWLGIPRELAEVYANRLDWHQVARLVQHGCPRRWPCALPADERTWDEGPWLPGTDSPCLPDRSRRWWNAISPGPSGSTMWPCDSQA